MTRTLLYFGVFMLCSGTAAALNQSGNAAASGVPQKASSIDCDTSCAGVSKPCTYQLDKSDCVPCKHTKETASSGSNTKAGYAYVQKRASGLKCP